jgi:hypothetical protein
MCCQSFHARAKRSFATLSARVGSIEDNRLGGWYSYRASKAALNQTRPHRRHRAFPPRTRSAVCCVASWHSRDATSRIVSRRPGLDVLTPAQSAQHLLSVIDQLDVRTRPAGFSIGAAIRFLGEFCRLWMFCASCFGDRLSHDVAALQGLDPDQ